jgi:pimeloyl-ACP methyl ester carboxylesterase
MNERRLLGWTRAGWALACAMMWAGCAQYATVSTTQPRFRPLAVVTGPLAAVEKRILRAEGLVEKMPEAALAELLPAAETAQLELVRRPNDAAALEAYNFAVGRVFSAMKQANLAPWHGPIQVPTSNGVYTITHLRDPRPQWNPDLYEFTPADEFRIGGTYVSQHEKKRGVGAPIVAVGRATNANWRADFSLPRVYYGVTAVLRFEGRRAQLAFNDPLAVENVTLGGRSFPMAADYTVPLAVMLKSSEPKKYELSRLLNPGKYAETARISRLQPYDPSKTVVLVVHGLMDTPATWTPLINQMRADPAIRQKYQFWFFSYPSGYPYPYSAAILRRELDAALKRFPLTRKMIVIGHSMGGCISRLLITDAGEKLWLDILERPPGEMGLSASSREMLEGSLIFNHRPEVGRVIFVSAPLKGSKIASNWLGRIGSSLVRMPSTLLKVSDEVMTTATFQTGELKLKRMPDSVDTLAPNNRFVLAINRIPVRADIPYHVICGDRGKGGNKDDTKPVMSDGIVPYWSSHMPGARSEKIVPSGHPAHQNPEAIAEVRRILLEAAGAGSR